MFKYFLKFFEKKSIPMFLIPYIAVKDHSRLRQYVQGSKNRNNARKEIIELKCIISFLEPLFYDVLVHHSSKINNDFSGPSNLHFRDTETDTEGAFIKAYRFDSTDYSVVFGLCSKCILYIKRPKRNEYGSDNSYFYSSLMSSGFNYQRGLKINLSDIQFKVLFELQKYCSINQERVEEFKKESSLQKVLQMR